MSNEVTLFGNAQTTKPEEHYSFDRYLNAINDGKWQDLVLTYRAIADKEQKAAYKKRIPAVTPSGKFDQRNASGLVEHNGFICMDIDEKDNTNINEKIERLKSDKYVYALHQSVGGYGYAIYFRIEPTKHREAFESLEIYLKNNYWLEADTSCKDVSRLRFVSFDPHLFRNDKAPVFKKYEKKESQYTSKSYHVHTEPDMDNIISQISRNHIDLTTPYDSWCNIGFAIANEYGERGRDYFHAISSFHAEYSPTFCDKKYDNFLKTHSGKIGIGTFFQKCKDAGIEIQTEKTRKYQGTTTSLIQKSNLKPEQILQNIEELAVMDGDDPNHAREVAEKTLKIPKDQLKKPKDENILPLIKLRLKDYDLKRNEVTHEIEYNGKPITDNDMNSIWLELASDLGTKCAKNYVNDIIGSSHTKSYNPFLQFFEANIHRKPQGELRKLVECLKTRTLYTNSHGVQEIVTENMMETFIEKWIVSLVASMHGTYSLLILVLCGAQGLGKTNFFRWLLPEELRDYYGESKLDRGKDDEILMCRKLILCDDEFSGKSKLEYKHLKQSASTQIYSLRQPYGRKYEDFRRYAVLCGTSNETEVINDPTGNRRIIPINLTAIDFDVYDSIDKTDVIMEAYWRYIEQGNESWQLTKRDIKLLEDCTGQNKQVDTMEELINIYFEKPDPNKIGQDIKFWSATEMQVHIEANCKQKVYPQRLGIALKTLGYELEQKRIDGKPKKGYRIRLTRYDVLGVPLQNTP